jgi:hypothetical protein
MQSLNTPICSLIGNLINQSDKQELFLSDLSFSLSINIIANFFIICKYFSHLLSSLQGVLLLPMSWREVGLHLP